MTKTTKNNFITCGITLGLFVVFGVLSMTGVLGSQYSGLLIPIGIYIILSISLNLTVGILGELSLGHAGFMCIGAYVGGIFSLMTEESINPSWLRMILALIVGGIAAAIFGILIGIPVLRLRGDYLAIHDAGAHGFSMGYNYNGKLRSAELLLREDGSVKMIRRAETAADYFSTFDFANFNFDL
jgi:ABC-type branched-subunit amino acid transport system permease subunit